MFALYFRPSNVLLFHFEVRSNQKYLRVDTFDYRIPGINLMRGIVPANTCLAEQSTKSLLLPPQHDLYARTISDYSGHRRRKTLLDGLKASLSWVFIHFAVFRRENWILGSHVISRCGLGDESD
jgi:hypothetical protein